MLELWDRPGHSVQRVARNSHLMTMYWL